MTPKQRSFAEQYVLDHNGAAAAVRAGYALRSARQTAHELLLNPEVRQLVAQHEHEAARRLAVTRERVLAELRGAIEIARLKADPMAMIAGWREIAKIAGLYAPERRKIELSAGQDLSRARMESMSDQELLVLMSGESAA